MTVLTRADIGQIATALDKRHEDLCTEIKTELERSGHQHFADLAGEVGDVGDASFADMLVDQDFAIVRRQVEELTEVEAAQKRLANADFGECVDCGAPIGLARLLVVPQAVRCIACQGQYEKMFAHESGPKL